jgi:hypothetical protein
MSAEIPAGAMRFNSDSQKLEYWNGSAWFQVHTATPNLATAGDRQPGARGLIGGGYDGGSPGREVQIQYLNISSAGNTVDFGDLTQGRSDLGAFSSSTRGVFAGGFPDGAYSDTLDFVTIASTGDATDFGNLTLARQPPAGCSNSTRGLVGGGFGNPGPGNTDLDIIDYVTIASTGDAVDFGNLTLGRRAPGALSSPVRGIWAGGMGESPAVSQDEIDFVTIATLGNAQDFGDLTAAKRGPSGSSNSTRGIFAGGRESPSPNNFRNDIDYITIASRGNAVQFGDLTTTRSNVTSCSSSTRGVFAGGYNPTRVNTIEYVEFATEGDAVDFGDLLSVLEVAGGCSNAHGGL